MNREIKFRAWSTTNKRFIEDVLVDLQGSVYCNDGINIYSQWRKITNVELVQYTGLKDKKGVEIYEGNVVQLLGITGKVVWSEYSSAFQIEFWLDGFLALRGSGNGAIYKTEEEYYDMMEVDCDQLIIIGNIYEHGHLLDNTGVEV